MTLHTSTFEYLKPTDQQMRDMAFVRGAFAEFTNVIDAHIPDGPDKTYLLRQLRDCAMWANIAITRNPDGSPRV
jgi:hypothetical protein